jgi:predicted O-methyltransferase YrrM
MSGMRGAMPKLLSLVYREQRDKFFGRRCGPPNKPWMRYREIEVIEEILERLRPTSCLEWGAGTSTLFFSECLPPSARWIAIDHQAEWVDRLNAQVGTMVDVHLIRPNHQPWTDPEGDGSYTDLADYVDFPTRFAPFDFVLIDGRARIHCLQKAREILKPDGIVILHDADRPQYDAGLVGYPHEVRLVGNRKNAGGLWIGSLGRPIGTVLDVARHQEVWQACRLAGRLLRC